MSHTMPIESCVAVHDCAYIAACGAPDPGRHGSDELDVVASGTEANLTQSLPSWCVQHKAAWQCPPLLEYSCILKGGEKTPAPKISALLRKQPVLLRANFVLTKDRKRPYYRHLCG